MARTDKKRIRIFDEGIEITPDANSIDFKGAIRTATAVDKDVTDDISGGVAGPSSSTDNSVPLFNGTTGKLLKDPAALFYSSNTLELRSGTTAQLFNIYDTFTSSSAYERMEIGVNPGGIGGNRFGIITTAAGGGTAQPLHLGTGGSAEIHLRTSDASRVQISSSGHVLATTDNSIDQGAAGANRFRTYYVGTGISIGGATASDASLAVRGAGTSLATKALLIEDSGGTDTFAIRNDGSLGFGKNFSLPDTSSYFAMRTGADFGGAITITNTVNGINAPVGGLSFQIRYAGTQEYGRAEGISVIVESSNTGTGNVLSAFTGSARITNASGKATTLRGAYFDANTDGATSGTVTNLTGIESVLYVSHASVTATNAYGLKISSFTNSGTITNTYGIHVGDITSGTQTNQAYNIYLSDTNARNYLGGSTTLDGNLISTPDSRSGAGAVSVTTLTTALTSTGVAEAITLANGTAGQIKTIVHDVDGGSMVLTPTTATGWSTATFAVAGDTLTLQYFTTRGWMVLSSYGTVVAL